jgi:Fibronectin type III domain
MKKPTTIISFLLFLLLNGSYCFSQCTAPTNLQSSMVGSSATFTWDAVPNATSYTVDFKYSAYDWNFIEYSETVTTNSLYLNDVMQSLDLTWRVIANCGATGSSNFTEASFTSPCALPVNLSTTNITQNTAILNWEAPAALGNETGAYVYAYRPAGVGASWISLGNSTNLSFPLTGLAAGVTYEWCVNQICAYYTGDPAISTFTTLPQPCGVASLWLPNQITSSQANLRWLNVPNASSYLVEYKASNSQNWISYNTNTLEKLITNLTPTTQYEWRVKGTIIESN